MKTALITGGSRGIGAATAEAFRKAGYGVSFFYLNNQEAAAKIQRDTGAFPICCDIRSSDAVNTAVNTVINQWKHIDVLVNCAGISHTGLLTDMSDTEWDDIIATNLTGAFFTCRAVLPYMMSRQSGSIINVASIWGEIGASCEVAYSAAKAGLIGLTKALAKESAPSNIRVNCVSPGVIQTDMLSCYSRETLRDLADSTPLSRLGTPQDIANAILWLADDNASFITGEILSVGGGFGK